MKDNFVAIKMSGSTEKWFETELNAEKYIDSVICEPGCKHCWVEWDIWSKDEWEELNREDDNEKVYI